VRRLLLAALVVLTVVPLRGAAATPPPGAEACPMFPADSFWHADVRSLPVHERSSAWLAAVGGSSRRLHPDFGDSGAPMPYGIPFVVVDGSHARTSVAFEYAEESDPGPFPFGPDTPLEGGADRHALMLDRSRCELSELYAADWNGGAPTAGSGAVWDLRSNALRPSGWTSADAAGLAILPGLLRLDEVRAGSVDHVVRMTASRTDRSFVWPARHQAGAARDPNLPPMGAWFRLRADYPTAGLRPETQVILEAFKVHGLVLADNGSNWYVTGSADAGWPSAVLDELKAVPAGAFDAVDTSSLMVSADSGAVRTASASPAPPTVAAPTSTTSTTTSSPRPTPTTAAAAPPPPPTTAAPPAAETTTTTTSTTLDPGPSTAAQADVPALAHTDGRAPAEEGGLRWWWLVVVLLATAGAGSVGWRRLRGHADDG
jgi:hypothetical protein